MNSFSPAPMERDEVLNPAWLSAALSTQNRRVNVRSVALQETIGWNCLTLRVLVEHDGGADLPSALCIKGLFGTRHKEYTENGVLIAESNFYRFIVPEVAMKPPRCFYAGVDETTGSGVLVLEDITSRNARFYNSLMPFTLSQVRQSLDQLASLHGRFWNAPLSEHPWMQVKLERFVSSAKVSPSHLTEAMHGPRGEGLPEKLKSGERIYAALGALHRRGGTIDMGFIHGDCHPGNFFEVDGAMGVLDFQIVQRGAWSLDIAYHLGSVLTVEDRRTHEQDLLRYYLDQLAAYGGGAPAFDIAWKQYREAVPYGMYLWAVTMRVDAPIIEEAVRRLGTSAADHGSFELLGL